MRRVALDVICGGEIVLNKNNDEINYHSRHRDRMRQRFNADPEMMTFQEHEMLEFILNTVIPRKDTNDIAHALIAQSGSLYGVFNATVDDLASVKGMTVSAAYLLGSIIPIVRKALRSSGENNMKKVLNYGDAADFFHTFFMSRNTECLCVMYMGTRYNIIKTVVINDLSPSSVSLNVRSVAATAIKCGARYVMLGHNHPSDSPMPSENDFMLIWDLFNALAGLDIILLDNFIFTEQGFLSFRNVGILHKFANEYNQRNPSHLLKEDNKSISLYVTELKQYLVKVSQLKEENLTELITVEEFIKENHRKKNDVRFPKGEFKKDSSENRKTLADEKLEFEFADVKSKPYTPRGEKEINEIAKQFSADNVPTYKRKALKKVSVENMVDPETIEIDGADLSVRYPDGNLRMKISASTRNIPVFVRLFDFKADKEGKK